MALLHCDSFDDRGINYIGDRYSSHQFNPGGADSGIYPGRTGNGLGLSTGILDVPDHITWTSSSTHQSMYTGVAVEAGRLSSALISIRYEGTPHIFVQLEADSTLSVYRYDGSFVLLAASGRIPAANNGFYYVELYGKIDPVDGAYEMRVNGTRWLSANGINTSATGGSLANQVRLIYNHAGIDGAVTVVDDFYIADDTAGAGIQITGFAGPVHVQCLEETANGAVNQWTPNAGTNYQAVDETTGEDDDATYVSSSTEGDVDLYEIDNLSAANVTVKAVAVHQWARKEDALYKGFIPVAYSGGSQYDGAQLDMSGSYGRSFQVFEVNPATNAAWTPAEVNSAQFGGKVTAIP